MFEVFETKTGVGEYLKNGEEQVNLKKFKEIIEELSFR